MAPWPTRIGSRPNQDATARDTPRDHVRNPERSRERERDRIADAPNTSMTEQQNLQRLLHPSGLGNLDLYTGPHLPLDGDSSSSDDEGGFRPGPKRPARPPGHTRSMSHPFPSIFPLRKKPSANANIGRTPANDSDNDTPSSSAGPRRLVQAPGPPNMSNPGGDNLRMRSKMRPPPLQPPNHARRRGGPAGGSKDFATGNCMTCASPLRWPKDVTVFKCTRCMTVIDLQPYDPSQQPQPQRRDRDRDRDGGGRQGPPIHNVPGSPRLHPKVSSISLDHTKGLVRKCLKTYLNSVLQPSIRLSTESPPLHDTNPFKKQLEEERRKAAESRMPNGDPSKNESTPPILISGYFDAAVDQPTLNLPKTRPQTTNANPSAHQLSTSYPEHRSPSFGLMNDCADENAPLATRQEIEAKRLFKPLEDYIISCLNSFECLNNSFPARRPSVSGPRPSIDQIRPSFSGGTRPQISKGSVQMDAPSSDRKQSFAIETHDRKSSIPTEPILTDFDAKLLLVGDFAENGLWWTGNQDELKPTRAQIPRHDSATTHSIVNGRSPCMDWTDLDAWYSIIINTAESWESVYDELVGTGCAELRTSEELQELESHILAAQEHTQRLLLKATEMVLKRPGRVVTEPHELRFLLVLLTNPLLHGPNTGFRGKYRLLPSPGLPRGRDAQSGPQGPVSGHHSGIIKRILGLIANVPVECHNHLISWFSRLPERRFRQFKDLVSSFVTYRLSRQHTKLDGDKIDVMGGLIPNMPVGRPGSSAATLHAALGSPARREKKLEEPPKKIAYDDDWQIRAAARVMSLLFTANNIPPPRRPELSSIQATEIGSARDRAQIHSQILPSSEFYNSLLDYSDLIADYEAWESKRGRFSFCQYPFFLSIWAKIKIMEHDARKQMEFRAREAFFDSIMTRKAASQWLVLRVRRDCLVEDSLKSVSEVVGSGSEDIKKGLKIDFVGEEGVDAGGLRKEWFQILIREVFHPDHGMFIYDEDSQYCYFNPNSFETSDQFFLVGVVLGLAIYNCTILDVAFPPFAFRKLLAAAPTPTLPIATNPRQTMSYGLEDLAEYRPRLAKGLQQLLEFDGDVESTFCLDFVVETDKYGAKVQVPLCPGGENMPVTNVNRREYVDLIVRNHLDIAVSRQFEPFKRGFFTVCGGNALSLFRPEEIELLVRGSDEALDINSLRAVAEYENWRKEAPPQHLGHSFTSPNTSNPTPRQATHQQESRSRNRQRSKSALTDRLHPEDTEPTIRWFWESFESATPTNQRRLLSFITGSDRIPATGAASLVIKINCLGDDCGRYPIARTCFNILQLHRYRNKKRLESVLWGAVNGSEGFGLK